MTNEKNAAPGRAAKESKKYSNSNKKRIDFQAINRVAIRALPHILARWLPDGKRIGSEWIARNPRRADNHAGSFKINMYTGRWADFATGDRGGDIISLAAYLAGIGQREAALGLSDMLGV